MILRTAHDPRTRTSLLRGSGLAAALVAGSFALAACGTAAAQDSGQQDPAPVAASSQAAAASGTGTQSEAAPAGTTSKAAYEGRPQLRLDSTEEEVHRYRKAYADCLTEHGSPDTPGTKMTPAEERAYEAARRACADKVPLLPPEMDPKKNPHYADAVRREVKCLQGHGFKVHLVPAQGSDPNSISWIYDSLPGDDVDIEKIQNKCRVQAYGGGAALTPGPA
ncbi:hypothetical protein Sme01_38640 [Sphaerisporangium melleum]|uniref:Secreted protein n=1 Tax=Sphaerisporangium melleum TaxID=321316 RepID=A0A917R2C4_9ACTN|nr:hypothetical protein [Sphaerisporangium melleum]GGK85525.1 hypothetical protein GCM10007964_30040 [Sphaerisporangium melleum]GII71388.1 hypothetical protein Sme01_38640 [Sphaerisporangium melleum]